MHNLVHYWHKHNYWDLIRYWNKQVTKCQCYMTIIIIIIIIINDIYIAQSRKFSKCAISS